MLAEDEGNFPGSASEPSADFRLHQRAHASAAIFWNGACNWLQGRDERGGFPTTIGDETAPDGGFDPAWRSTDATTAERTAPTRSRYRRRTRPNDRCGSCRAGGSKRDADDIGARRRPPMNVHRRLQCRSCRQPFYQRFMLTRESSEYRLACPRCEGVAAYWLPGDPLGQPTGNVGVSSEEPE